MIYSFPSTNTLAGAVVDVDSSVTESMPLGLSIQPLLMPTVKRGSEEEMR